MRTILATGATGLIGSRFIELYSDKYEILNLDLTTGVDITDLSSLESYIRSHPADSLIHLAAFTDTNRAFAESGDKNGLCYKVNVVGTKNIVDICRKLGIHLIHVSTDFVFDGKNPPAGGYTEDDPVSPIEWYGETKVMAEKLVMESESSRTIVRLAYPYRATYDLKPDLIQKIRVGLESGQLSPQFTDTVITPTFIDDISQAFAKIIELKPQGIFHIVGSDSLSPYDLARKVALAYGFDPSVVKEGSLTEYLKSATRPFARTVVMSNIKASQTLGLHFASLDEGLVEIKKQQGL
ncbi:MAG: sugar nucleotide-binding protein [bacterium]